MLQSMGSQESDTINEREKKLNGAEQKQGIVCVFIPTLYQVISLFLEPIFDNSSANLE